MERSLGGILLLIATVLFGIGVGTFWLQRAVFSPEPNRSQAEAILDDADIRREITTAIVAATASVVEREPTELAVFVDQIIDSAPGAIEMTEIVDAAHRRVIGLDDEIIRIDGEQMITIVRDQRVAEVPGVTLPVPRVGTLVTMRNVASWTVPITLGAALVLSLLALATRPDRREVQRAVGEALVSAAVGVLVIGYLLPTFLVPAIDDSAWTRSAAQLASRSLPVLLGTVAVLTVAGGLIWVSAGSTGRRKQWSTPLAVGRYREERRWS